jgi:hypothetical protein
MDGKPFMTAMAARRSIPRSFVGALREVTVSVIGEPNDFLVEVHTGAWLRNMLMPGTAGLIIAGPIGGAVGAGATAIVAVDYQRKLSKRIMELVKDNSKKEVTLDKVETFA